MSLSYASSTPVTTPSTNAYSARLAALKDARASGVYAIYDARTRECLYVGETHAGDLYGTITRHFRRRRGGTAYDRRAVRVAIVRTRPDQAASRQYAAIQALAPRDNTPSLPNPPEDAVRLNVDREYGRAVAIIYERDGRRYQHDFTGAPRLYAVAGGTYLLIGGGLRAGRWIRG